MHEPNDLSSEDSKFGKEETEKTAENQIFFSVGIAKLLLLDVLTFGFYDLVWMYKNWKFIRDKRGRSVNPILRTIFAPLFVWQLFAELSEAVVEEGGKKPAWPPALMAIFYIVTNFSARYGARHFNDSFELIAVLGLIPLVLLQVRVNEVNTRKSIVTNTRFSKINWVVAIIFVLIWILSLIGYMLPATPYYHHHHQ